MNKVQSRFLQVVLSAVSGDRITVGLVHWDRTRMRTASSFAALPHLPRDARKPIEDTVAALLRQAEAVTNQHDQMGLFDLADVMPVREGMGARLGWSEVRTARTSDADAHFRELCSLVGLELARPRTSAPKRRIEKLLVAAGNRLLSDAPGRILVEHTVQDRHSFASPVSWKNGVWNHTLVSSFARPSESGIRHHTRALLGLLDLALPEQERAVVVAVMPAAGELQRIAQQESELVAAKASRTRVVRASAETIDSVVEELVRQIRTGVHA